MYEENTEQDTTKPEWGEFEIVSYILFYLTYFIFLYLFDGLFFHFCFLNFLRYYYYYYYYFF